MLEVYDVLEVIVKEYMERKRNDQTGNPSLFSILIEHFTAIFWSLKLHLKFHRDATATSEDDAEADKKLKDMARWELVCLTADDMNEDPDEKMSLTLGVKSWKSYVDISESSSIFMLRTHNLRRVG